MSSIGRRPTRARSSFLYCEFPEAQKSALNLYAHKARQASYSASSFDLSAICKILKSEPPRNRWAKTHNMSEYWELKGLSRKKQSRNLTETFTPKSQKRMSAQRTFNESNSLRVLQPQKDVNSLM